MGYYNIEFTFHRSLNTLLSLLFPCPLHYRQIRIVRVVNVVNYAELDGIRLLSIHV